MLLLQSSNPMQALSSMLFAFIGHSMSWIYPLPLHVPSVPGLLLYTTASASSLFTLNTQLPPCLFISSSRPYTIIFLASRTHALLWRFVIIPHCPYVYRVSRFIYRRGLSVSWISLFFNAAPHEFLAFRVWVHRSFPGGSDLTAMDYSRLFMVASFVLVYSFSRQYLFQSQQLSIDSFSFELFFSGVLYQIQ
jgi:hypothetical protein